MTTIREFTDSVHAGLVLSYLQDNEIDVFLADENSAALDRRSKSRSDSPAGTRRASHSGSGIAEGF